MICDKRHCWFFKKIFLYPLRVWQELQFSCLPFLFGSLPRSTIVNIFFLVKVISFNWGLWYWLFLQCHGLFQCPFAYHHGEGFVQLVGDIEHRNDASSFQEPSIEETELSNKMQDSISSGWYWISQMLGLSFWKSCLLSAFWHQAVPNSPEY